MTTAGSFKKISPLVVFSIITANATIAVIVIDSSSKRKFDKLLSSFGVTRVLINA